MLAVTARRLAYRMISPRWLGGETAHRELAGLREGLDRAHSWSARSKLLESTKQRLRTALQHRVGEIEAEALSLKLANVLLARYHQRARIV